jgi:hypothetical protein
MAHLTDATLSRANVGLLAQLAREPNIEVITEGGL